MSRCVSTEAPDKLLCLSKVASPKKHRRGEEQRVAQIDRLVALGCQIYYLPRGPRGLIRKPDQPFAARKSDRRTNFMIVAKKGDLRGVRGLSFGQAEFAVSARATCAAPAA